MSIPVALGIRAQRLGESCSSLRVPAGISLFLSRWHTETEREQLVDQVEFGRYTDTSCRMQASEPRPTASRSHHREQEPLPRYGPRRWSRCVVSLPLHCEHPSHSSYRFSSVLPFYPSRWFWHPFSARLFPPQFLSLAISVPIHRSIVPHPRDPFIPRPIRPASTSTSVFIACSSLLPPSSFQYLTFRRLLHHPGSVVFARRRYGISVFVSPFFILFRPRFPLA